MTSKSKNKGTQTGGRSTVNSTAPVKSQGAKPSREVEPYSGPRVGPVGTVATMLPNLLTRDQISEPITVTDLVDQYAETMTREAVASDVYDRVQWDRAILVHRGMALVGTEDGFRTQGDYATALGVSAGYLTRLKRLGLIISRYAEVAPGTEEWRVICAVAQGKAGAVLAPEEKALPVRSFRKHVKTLVDAARESGKADAGAKAIAPPAKREPQPEGHDAPEAAKPQTVTTFADAMRAIHALEELSNTFSAEDWSKMEDRLNLWIKRGVERRVLKPQGAKSE